MHSYVPYFLRLIIVYRTILNQNHFGGSIVPAEPAQRGMSSYPPSRHEYGLFVFWLLKAVETFQIQQKNRKGHIYIQVMQQKMAYCA